MPKKKGTAKTIRREEKKMVRSVEKKLNHTAIRASATSKISLGRGFRRAQANIAHNSEYYVRSLFDPMSYPHVRIPEPLAVATSTGIATGWVTVPLYTGSGSGYAGGIVIAPSLQGCYARVAAEDLVGPPVVDKLVNPDQGVNWEVPSDHPQISTFAASNIKSYRVVSMGVQVLDVGAWNQKGVNFLVGTFPQEWFTNTRNTVAPFSNTATSPAAGSATTPITTFANSTHFQQLDSTTEAVEHLNMIYLPATLSPMSFHGAAQEMSGATWRDTTTTAALFDNVIMIYFYSNGTVLPTDSVQVRIHMNIEFIPQPSGNQIYEPRIVEGSRGATAAALGDVLDEVEKKGWTDELKAGIATYGPTVARVLMRAYAQRSNTGWGGTIDGPGGTKDLETKSSNVEGKWFYYPMYNLGGGHHLPLYFMDSDLGSPGNITFKRVEYQGTSVLMSATMAQKLGYPVGVESVPIARSWLSGTVAAGSTKHLNTAMPGPNYSPDPDEHAEPVPPGHDGQSHHGSHNPSTMPHSPTPGSGFVNIPRL